MISLCWGDDAIMRSPFDVIKIQKYASGIPVKMAKKVVEKSIKC